MVQAASVNSLHYRPNVVLINAGTNDCRLAIDIPNTSERMKVLIDSLLKADGMDKTTIILSTLIPSTEVNTTKFRPDVNNQFRELAVKLRSEGYPIVLADMDPEKPDPGNGWIVSPADFQHGDSVDDTHPNEHGYAKMAYVWYKAIQAADDAGFLKSPNKLDPEDEKGGVCVKEYGDGVSAGGLTQRGSGEDDGIYQHSSASKGIVLSVVSKADQNQWFFARLFRRDRDDLLGWFEKDDGSVAYGTWRNTGQDSDRFVKIADTSVDDNCIQAGVNFIDINGKSRPTDKTRRTVQMPNQTSQVTDWTISSVSRKTAQLMPLLTMETGLIPSHQLSNPSAKSKTTRITRRSASDWPILMEMGAPTIAYSPIMAISLAGATGGLMTSPSTGRRWVNVSVVKTWETSGVCGLRTSTEMDVMTGSG